MLTGSQGIDADGGEQVDERTLKNPVAEPVSLLAMDLAVEH